MQQQNIVRRAVVRRATPKTVQKTVQDPDIAENNTTRSKPGTLEFALADLGKIRLAHVLSLVEYPQFVTLALYLAFVFAWARICISWSPFTHVKEKRYVIIMRVLWPFAKFEIPGADLNVVPIDAMDVIDRYVDWEPEGNLWAMEMKDGFAIAGVICAVITHLLC